MSTSGIIRIPYTHYRVRGNLDSFDMMRVLREVLFTEPKKNRRPLRSTSKGCGPLPYPPAALIFADKCFRQTKGSDELKSANAVQVLEDINYSVIKQEF
jgi:hypothetical protein